MKFVSIINYCTNDYMFLKPCVDAVRPFSSEIIVPYCDHFLDGTPENRELLNKSIAENPGVTFIEFDYNPSQSSRWHHNACRKIGFDVAPKDTDYFMLLDVDEIIEPDNFIAWWKTQEKNPKDSYRLACYWYFRDFKYRSKNWEEAIALVKGGLLTTCDDLTFSNEERKALFWSTLECRRMDKCKLNGLPFSHHYSWVRSKEGMLKKVRSWGHNKDKDWVTLVEKEFEQPFRGKDVIFGDREYDMVEPLINVKIQ
jgi:hypothetical protein